MKKRKVLYTLSGIFNCIIGGIGCFFGFMIVVLSGLIRKMFKTTVDMLDEFVQELVNESYSYEYLLSASNDEIISFVMGVVYGFSVLLLVLGIIWITFGVFIIKLAKSHYIFFGSRPKLKLWFVIGSWILLTFNIANITTTIAVYLKDKEDKVSKELYSAKD